MDPTGGQSRTNVIRSIERSEAYGTIPGFVVGGLLLGGILTGFWQSSIELPPQNARQWQELEFYAKYGALACVFLLVNARRYFRPVGYATVVDENRIGCFRTDAEGPDLIIEREATVAVSTGTGAATYVFRQANGSEAIVTYPFIWVDERDEFRAAIETLWGWPAIRRE